MDRVSASFHKNVFLLTKFVTPNNDFKKYFKEGMFDKPNTAGFIHVSYYLLSIYYKENVKNKVPWPVICKQTESQFRNDMRKCLSSIANDHPDVNFPPILASHLLLAGGTKFILIMWKFSVVVLREYLRQEHQCVVSNAPKPGPCQELTMTFLKNVTRKNESAISKIQEDRKNSEKEANDFLDEKTQEQSHLKEKILKLMEELKEVVEIAPANNTAKKKLLNIDDKEIINLWIGSMNNKTKSIEINCDSLEELDKLLKYINNIVSNITGNSQTLNTHNFDRINVDMLYKLVPPDRQILLYNLYQEDSLNLQNFFFIFNLWLQKYGTCFQKKNFQGLSSCSEQLQMSNRQLRTAIDGFQNLHKQIETFNTKLKKNRKLNDSQGVLADAPEYAKVLFMPSPSIRIINNYETGLAIPQNDLKLTPAESAHKNLFERHAKSNKKGIFLATKLPCMKINFDDETFSDTNSFKSSMSLPPRFQTPQKKGSSLKIADKYSRIFSTIRPSYDKKINNSMMSMMSESSMKLPILSQENSMLMMDSCNSSQEFSQEPLLANPNLNSTVESEKVEEKPQQKNQKRRSISDLVERYKILVQKRDV